MDLLPIVLGKKKNRKKRVSRILLMSEVGLQIIIELTRRTIDYISYHTHVSVAMTYGVVILEDKLFSIVTKSINSYHIIMQNGGMLILSVLDKNNYFMWIPTL